MALPTEEAIQDFLDRFDALTAKNVGIYRQGSGTISALRQDNYSRDMYGRDLPDVKTADGKVMSSTRSGKFVFVDPIDFSKMGDPRVVGEVNRIEVSDYKQHNYRTEEQEDLIDLYNLDII